MADEEDFLKFVNEENTQIYQTLYHEFLNDLSAEKEPVVIVFGGSPGSGKSSWRHKYYNNMKNMHLHDMDEILVRLPEYQKDLITNGYKFAFEKWWPTARKIADKLVEYAIKCKYSILYDRTCGADQCYIDLFSAKKQGYDIKLIGFCIDSDVAYERICKREAEDGRTITRAILDEYRSRFSALWPYYLAFVDEASLYENSESIPRLIFSTEKGIIDADRYEAFLQEGIPFQSYFLEKFGKPSI